MIWTDWWLDDACNEAKAWLEGQSGPEAAWHACPRGDWLAWLIKQVAAADVRSRGGPMDWHLVRSVRRGCTMLRLALPSVPEELRGLLRARLNVIEAAGGKIESVPTERALGVLKNLNTLSRCHRLALQETIELVHTGCHWYWDWVVDDVMAIVSEGADSQWGRPALDISARCADIIRAGISYAEIAAAAAPIGVWGEERGKVESP